MMRKSKHAALAAAVLGVAMLGVLPSASNARVPSDPTVEQVFTDSVKALGGKEAIEKINTLHTVMEMMAPGPSGDMKVEMETLWSRAGGRIIRTKMAGMGEAEMGTDGKTSWKKGMMGSGPLSKGELDELNHQCSMMMHILEPQRSTQEEMTKMESAGTATFDGRECHRLRFVTKKGEEGYFFYDVKTSLPAGAETEEKDGETKVTQTMVLGDWQEEKGVKFYRTMTMASPEEPKPLTMKVTKVEVNTLEASAFTPPAGAGAAPTKPGSSTPSGGAAAKEIAFEDLTPEQQTEAQKTLEGLKKSGNVQAMKMAVGPIESSISQMPPERQKTMQYVVQELKKEIERLGG